MNHSLLNDWSIDEDQMGVATSLSQYNKTIVEAAPGCGKTFTGVFLAIHAFQQGWTSSSNPTLFLTFSRNARNQIKNELNKFREKGWLTSLEEKAIKIANYHSFYYETLSKRAGVWGCPKPIRPATVSECKERINSILKAQGISGNRKSLKDKIHNYDSLLLVREEDAISSEVASLCARVAVQGIIDGKPAYGDFAPLMYNLISNSACFLSWLRTKYPLVVFDEFQDTDEIQWKIVDKWQPEKVAVFYDRCQMIYGWRGATEKRISEFIDRFEIPLDAQRKLTKIYRCGDKVHFASFIQNLRSDDLLGGNVFSGPKNWLNMKAIPQNGYSACVRCLNAIRYGKLINPMERTAIITRYNALACYLKNNLVRKPQRGSGPYYRCSLILPNDSSVEEFLRDSLVELRNAKNHSDVGRWIGKLLDMLLHKEYSDISFEEELSKPASEVLKRRRKEKIVRVRSILVEYWDTIEVGDYQSIRDGLKSIIEIARFLMDGVAFLDPNVMFYIKQFIYAISSVNYESWDIFCDRLDATLFTTSYFGTRYDQMVYIMNVFQTKGREFDHVIIPWLSSEKEPPHAYSPNYNYEDINDRRLLYVAFTRARNKVTVLYPEESPSRFLYEWKLLNNS